MNKNMGNLLFYKVLPIRLYLQSLSEGIYLPCLWYLALHKKPVLEHFTTRLSLSVTPDFWPIVLHWQANVCVSTHYS